jgi:hypothetical protein
LFAAVMRAGRPNCGRAVLLGGDRRDPPELIAREADDPAGWIGDVGDVAGKVLGIVGWQGRRGIVGPPIGVDPSLAVEDPPVQPGFIGNADQIAQADIYDFMICVASKLIAA